MMEGPSKNAHRRFGFPRTSDSSLSDWLAGAQGDPLIDHRTSPELPSKADLVIIGSGMTGTLVANHYIKTWPERKVVLLEARSFCSGATGRNAGHCKPDQWRGFLDYKALFGKDQALKILQNEQDTWAALVAYVHENDIDCDLWVGDTLDVPISHDAAAIAMSNLQSVQAAGGNTAHIKVTHEPAEAAKMSGIKDAKACYAWPASTLNPWKLTSHIMRCNLRRGVNLQTHTEVTQVISSQDHLAPWIVRSARGDIKARQIVHATNAYSSALEPSLRGLITPSPHICNRIPPPAQFLNLGHVEHSYGVLLPSGGLITINPRSTFKDSILFGGSNAGQQEFGKWLQGDISRCTDDSLTSFPSVAASVKQFTESQLPGWEPATDELKDYNTGWSGIIGLSADTLPFVGQLPNLPGQWICAGHHGHGMARIFTAAPGLVKLMGGSSWPETNLPEAFEITPGRVGKLKGQHMGMVL